MRRNVFPWALLLAGVPALLAATLYDQSIARRLDERFPQKEISYLLLDARTGTVVAARWEAVDRPVPVGSLVKPFTAVAYGQANEFQYPEFVCRGSAGGCWYAPGHGRIGLTQAIAHSCNAYFRQLARRVDPAQARAVLDRFGLTGPPPAPSADTLIGLGEDWRIKPLSILDAYRELSSRAAEPGVRDVIRGMALSAQIGTGRGVGRALGGRAAWVKTGTAPCIHGVEWSGDGYALILYPANSPRLALLVRAHGKPGADTAVVAGQMLRAVLDGE